MPLRSYGVLKATILDRRLATDRTDHYQLLCGVGTTRWRVAINSHSDVPPSDVMYAAFRDHRRGSRTLKEGWRVLRPGEGLDYIRGGLCKPEQFKPLPLSKPGANNDLNELFDLHLHRGAKVYAFGEPSAPDRPERGVHDVHQNQGNIRQYRRDDGVWQDGGLLVAARHRLDGDPAALPVAVVAHGRRQRPRALEQRRMPKPPLPAELEALPARAQPGHDRHAQARRCAAQRRHVVPVGGRPGPRQHGPLARPPRAPAQTRACR